MKLWNKNILVKIIEEDSGDQTTASGIIIPKEKMEEDQVAKGFVIQVPEELSDKLSKGETILFHKFNPTDIHMKYDSDQLEEYWFVKETDIISSDF